MGVGSRIEVWPLTVFNLIRFIDVTLAARDIATDENLPYQLQPECFLLLYKMIWSTVALSAQAILARVFGSSQFLFEWFAWG